MTITNSYNWSERQVTIRASSRGTFIYTAADWDHDYQTLSRYTSPTFPTRSEHTPETEPEDIHSIIIIIIMIIIIIL